MTEKMQITVRIDGKGRLTLPISIRQAMKIEAGDTVFLKYEPDSNQLRMAPIQNPFDVLAEEAINEYQQGHTRTIEGFARELDIRI